MKWSNKISKPVLWNHRMWKIVILIFWFIHSLNTGFRRIFHLLPFKRNGLNFHFEKKLHKNWQNSIFIVKSVEAPFPASFGSHVTWPWTIKGILEVKLVFKEFSKIIGVTRTRMEIFKKSFRQDCKTCSLLMRATNWNTTDFTFVGSTSNLDGLSYQFAISTWHTTSTTSASSSTTTTSRMHRRWNSWRHETRVQRNSMRLQWKFSLDFLPVLQVVN